MKSLLILLLTITAHAQSLTTFDSPFLFSYLSYKDKTSHQAQDGTVTINAPTNKGGAGQALTFDASTFPDHSPTLTVKPGPQNKSATLRLKLIDSQKAEADFLFDLSKAPQNTFTTLLPIDIPALARPGFDLAQITSFQLQGDWKNTPIHLTLDSIDLAAPTPEVKAARAKLRQQAADKAEAARQKSAQKKQALEALLAKGAPHPADGPRLAHLAAAAPDLIGLELLAGHIPRTKPVPYQKQEGDVIKPGKKSALAWQDNKPTLLPLGYEVHRTVNGRLRKIGTLNKAANTIWTEKMTGQPLLLDAVDDPRAYRITIGKNPPIHPTAIFRKSKPNKVAQISGDFSGQHFIYLQLPAPLAEGQTYTIDFHGLNTRKKSASFTFDSTSQRSESLHVNHLGYRPADPFKRAYLSLWTGTGGATKFPFKEFHLIDPSGKIHHTAPITLAIPADQSEPFSNPKNHSGTHVYHLDFHSFQTPGTYRVHVPGLGTSDPFEISATTWLTAFKTSMHGLLCHRNGLALGPPLTDYHRPRPMHPADGIKVFRTDVSFWDGESEAIQESLTRLLGPDLDLSNLEEIPDAWGGYMDAGDWDRRSQHLIVSYRHLELLEMFPKKLADLKLTLPESEAQNNIPDILDEALWNLDFYRRLQDENGGISSGVESTAHPRPAEASWQETLLLGAYISDPESSYRFAATAAKAARLLKDHPLAETNLQAAIRAFDWAEKNADFELAAARARRAKRLKNVPKDLAEMRALAAIELHRSAPAPRFQKAAADTAKDEKLFYNIDIATAYALLPKTTPEPLAALRQKARQTLLQTADQVLKFSGQNGFNLAPGTRYLPMMGYTAIWSTPGAAMPPVLPRAHFLSGDEKYLSGTLASTHYPAGANPMNMCYTTGLGHRFPQNPLHVDSWQTGQPAPRGTTIEGQSDPAANYPFDQFAHQWFLNRFGGVNSKNWPTAEAYIDLGPWPSMNEYTVHQNISPTSYTWAYLALRP